MTSPSTISGGCSLSELIQFVQAHPYFTVCGTSKRGWGMNSPLYVYVSDSPLIHRNSARCMFLADWVLPEDHYVSGGRDYIRIVGTDQLVATTQDQYEFFRHQCDDPT